MQHDMLIFPKLSNHLDRIVIDVMVKALNIRIINAAYPSGAQMCADMSDDAIRAPTPTASPSLRGPRMDHPRRRTTAAAAAAADCHVAVCLHDV